jgi:hypothetical protein
MALHIASPHVDRLARELVAVTGEKLTTAVGKALEERLARVRPNGPSPSEEERWRQIEEICARSRAEAAAMGFVAPTKEEMDELWGM